MLEIKFLGTGGSMPTEGRNLPAIAIRYQGWIFLFDCGEDVQRQFERAGLGNNKDMCIFITHMHADHILGLPGLLLRFSLLGRIKPLSIYGPRELIEYVKVNQKTINLGTVFETIVYAIEPGIVYQEGPITIRAFLVDHRGFALGYEIVFQSPTGEFIPEKAEELGIPKGPLWSALAKGDSVTLADSTIIRPEDVTNTRPNPLKVVYSGDTRPCQALRESAQGADILISEAMYTTEHADLAQERGHSTAQDIAKLASDAGVKLLILTHYSPRYDDGSTILDEGKAYFPDTILACDLLSVALDKDGNKTITQPSSAQTAKDQA
jgi:ribonuclease Z